jgi:hypothetical protein
MEALITYGAVMFNDKSFSKQSFSERAFSFITVITRRFVEIVRRASIISKQVVLRSKV